MTEAEKLARLKFFTKPIFVLGSGGFVGKHISNGLKLCSDDIKTLAQQDFQLGNFAHYAKYPFSDSIIVDCISKIDGTPEDVYDNNFVKLTGFIDYLRYHHAGFVYIYFSTISTSNQKIKDQNYYVKSKAHAEEYIEENLPDYSIVQLSYPFGKGESPKRLISRIIDKIKLQEKLIINDLRLSLMPIDQLEKDSCELISISEKKVQYFNSKFISLEEVVRFIYDKLGMPYNYAIAEKSGMEILPARKKGNKLERFINPLDAIGLMI